MICISFPNNQHQQRTLHVKEDVLPNALCLLLCPVSAALASICKIDLIYTSYTTKKKVTGERDRRDTGGRRRAISDAEILEAEAGSYLRPTDFFITRL